MPQRLKVVRIDLVSRRPVEIQHLHCKASGLDEDFCQGTHADVVDLADGRLDLCRAVLLDVLAELEEGLEVVGMGLDPRARQQLVGLVSSNTRGQWIYLEVCDDCHGHAHVVEARQQLGSGGVVDGGDGGAGAAEQVEALIGKVLVEVLLEADGVEQVAQGPQPRLLLEEAVLVADAQQGLEVGESNCWPSQRQVAEPVWWVYLSSRSGHRLCRSDSASTWTGEPGGVSGGNAAQVATMQRGQGGAGRTEALTAVLVR